VTERTEDSARASQRPGEIVEMPPDERVRRLDALWQRLMDPDGFDRKALANRKEATD
jgi:hypothetical protein